MSLAYMNKSFVLNSLTIGRICRIHECFFFVVLGGGKTVPLLYTSMFKEGTGLIVPPTITIGTNIYLYIIMYFFKAIQ